MDSGEALIKLIEFNFAKESEIIKDWSSSDWSKYTNHSRNIDEARNRSDKSYLLSDWLVNAFNWDQTKQGEVFWHNIYLKILELEKNIYNPNTINILNRSRHFTVNELIPVLREFYKNEIARKLDEILLNGIEYIDVDYKFLFKQIINNGFSSLKINQIIELGRYWAQKELEKRNDNNIEYYRRCKEIVLTYKLEEDPMSVTLCRKYVLGKPVYVILNDNSFIKFDDNDTLIQFLDTNVKKVLYMNDIYPSEKIFNETMKEKNG